MQTLGLVACGDVAFRTYIPGILPHADRATIVATFDPIAERAARAAMKFPHASAYTDWSAFLKHPGMTSAFNLTPANLHGAITRQLLEAGLHVFSEKPIAGTVAEGQALADLARSKQLLLLCAPATMVTDRFEWIRALVEDNRLGNLTVGTGQMTSMGPAAWRDYTGDPAVFYSKEVGPVVDLGVYVLHGLTGIFGPAKRVQALAGTAIPTRNVLVPRLLGGQISVASPDIVSIQLDFGGDRFAQVLASFAVPATHAPAIEIHGERGSISIDSESWYDSAGGVDIYLIDETPLGAQGWLHGVANPNPQSPPGEHLIGAGPRHFIDCLENNVKPVLTAEHAIHVLDVILSAYQSADRGRAVDTNTVF